MSRVYKRKFDWAEARRLRVQGLTLQQIADQFGVTDTAIRNACNPEASDRSAYLTSIWMKQGICIDCGAQISRSTLHDRRRCHSCASKARVLANDTHAYCSTCKQWLPRDQFARSQSRFRTVHNECRECQTKRRRAYRELRKVPCIDCGAMTHSTAPGQGRNTSVARCRSCAQRARHSLPRR